MPVVADMPPPKCSMTRVEMKIKATRHKHNV